MLHILARMNIGGPAHQVVRLLEGLDPERFTTRLVTGQVSVGEDDYLVLRGNSVGAVVLPDLRRDVGIQGEMRALRSLTAEIRRFRPDVAHTHTAKAGALGRVAACLCGVPRLVHTFHGHLLYGYFSPRGTAVIRRTEQALAPLTHRLVTVGAQVRDDLLAAGVGRPEQYAAIPPVWIRSSARTRRRRGELWACLPTV